MKNLYLIGGTMGIGKTAVCQSLKKKLDHSVFLDGDWCWDSDPFVVNNETKKMVMNNICYLLNSFLSCSVYENIIFCWVMHEQAIIDEIVSRIDLENTHLHCISLIGDENTVVSHLRNDIERGIREEAVIERSLSRLRCYDTLSTVKIDVTNLSLEQIVEKIICRNEEETYDQRNHI